MASARQSGFTLIEILVATAVLVLFFSAVMIITQVSTELIGKSKLAALAVTVAERRLEEARNLPYADVGTQGGIPAGSLQQTETRVIQSTTFTIRTSVFYIDDPFDGVAPADGVPTDYKRVRVEVEWDGVLKPNTPIVLLTDVAPLGRESDEGKGTLEILVFNASGNPLSNASVHVEAPNLTPAVSLDTLTDANGKVSLPGAEACLECYRISVSKSGYSQDRTYGTDEVDNPSKPHVSVFPSALSQASFSIDAYSTMVFRAVRSKTFNFSPFQGVQMRVHGTKEVGRTATSDPVYKFDQLVTTGFNGQVTVANMEWDTYAVELPSGSSVIKAASWPFSPFPLLPASTGTFTIVVESSTPNSLAVSVLDSTPSPIASASIELRHSGLNYVATKSTGIAGEPDQAQVFFPGLTASLEPYLITVRSPGFLDETGESTVSGTISERYQLTPLP